MKRGIKLTYKVVRTVLVTVLAVLVLSFVAIYAALLTPSVQERVKTEAEKALSELLKTDVTIGQVSIKPFNQVVLHDVAVPDQQGDSLLLVAKLGAGLDLNTLVKERRLLFTYGEIIGMKGRVTRPDKDSPTNMQFIIDALKPKPGNPPKPFDVQVHTVVIRQSELSYDVLSEPHRKADQFDPNHIAVSNLRADVTLPHLRNNDFDIEVKRLSFDEQSGFVLRNLAVHTAITDTSLTVNGLRVELPRSRVAVDDFTLAYSSLGNLGNELRTMPLSLRMPDATVTPADLKAFVPALEAWNNPLEVTVAANGNPWQNELHVSQLQVHDGNGDLSVDLNGFVAGWQQREQIRYAFPKLNVKASTATLARVGAMVPSLTPQVRDILARYGAVAVDADVNGNAQALKVRGNVDTRVGSLAVDGLLEHGNEKHFKGHIATPGLRVGYLLNRNELIGEVAMDADVDLRLHGRNVSGAIDGRVDHIDIKGRRLHHIDADVTANDGQYQGRLTINDPSGALELNGTALLAGADTRVEATAQVRHLDLGAWGAKGKLANGALSMDVDAAFVGNTLDRATGSIDINDITLAGATEHDWHLDHLAIAADNATTPQRIDVNSDFFNGQILGQYDFKTLVPAVKTMLSQAFPQYFAPYIGGLHAKPNDLTFSFTLEPSDELQQLAKLPVQMLDNAVLDGFFNESTGNMAVNITAPYLLQGKKIIEGTTLAARIDSTTHGATLHASSLIPAKNGKIAVTLDAAGRNDRLDADLGWRMMREQDFHGNLNLSALLQRTAQKGIKATIDINPTQLVFNDTAWQVEPGRVLVHDGVITVEHLEGHNDQQWVRIAGMASRNPDHELCLELNDMSLDYVFETLNIPNVDFGGRATGKFFASDLFSGAPRLSTPGLHIDGLAYNKAVMGDADIQSSWMNEERAVALRADVKQPGDTHTIVDGAIFVANDSLYLEFDADHANVAFMRPFMAAFTSDVQGQVSGHATLAGNFSTINLAGDICADSLRFKLDYTGVTYTCAGDSVHVVPDYIKFSDVRIHDRDGHEARMDGWLRHRAFHDPSFEFSITRANDLLCYDTNATDNPVWYGTIYGDGAAFVKGEPGQVDIKVNMTTAPRSTFTFVLSDTEQAADYNFITFRDRDRHDDSLPEVQADTIPERVRLHMEQARNEEPSMPTHYTIDLQGDITPDANLVLVMDPVGGDRVKATGRGSMRMTYNDADEMTVFGTYTLERGNYNFTLQDIIIKDFTIRDGSSITFQGDPYAATLDLKAVYALNANLRDLDESFAQDREINRTNVPVHALLQARGPISQPDIDFDLEFPTLTTDAYRKVRSIISTDEMMNRQIIYLLALNRFYTPDYTGGESTRGNELTAVASSTISSQLSSMLGKMSDKWSISPNFRSDKGDFSDMEVDVALSSQLLNNRLLINGNLGYRDLTYSNQGSNFIGDFDIEYLLNPRGTLRLKAYNHFNDQNYYVRNALTTQGVGLVWKHDFDRPFDFLRRSITAQPRTATVIPRDTTTQESTQPPTTP
ncbi:MAG: translocation/assembly module TamB [Muribaculaceae bacterium]|nr:translocation/assembly module TamB [Muribaculaceae bacterium]